MSMDEPAVVALVATCNGQEHISATLESLQAQTYSNLRVLISDDASTDSTLDMCRNAAANDFRIRVIEQKKRLGWIGNINALLKEAEGDYFFFMPHDDLIKPTYVEDLVKSLENNRSAVIAFSDIDCWIDGKHYELQAYRDLEGESNRVRRARKWLNRRSRWCVPYRGLFRAESVRWFKCLRANSSGEFGADWSWLIHMTLLGEFVRVPKVLYQRNRGSHSLSISWKYTARKWLSVTRACGSEIWRSNISFWEKCYLQFFVMIACVKVLIKD